jgi:hypothetical protein
MKKFLQTSFKLSNVEDEYTKQLVGQGALGFFCGNSPEAIPAFDKAPCETVLAGTHNSFIVLGRDRNASWSSGLGGQGKLHCGMIDIVAGRGQLVIAQNKNKNTDALEGVELVGPMFHSDASRIYITQKAENIDKYFGLKESKGPSSENKAAIAIKSDHLRIIGREKVRIYAGRGYYAGFDPSYGETNSLGNPLKGQVIELQVGNQELHPMVLGNKLAEYLKRKNASERKIHGMLNALNVNITVLNSIVATLPGAAIGLAPMMKKSIESMSDTISETLNTYIQELDALDTDLIPGKNNILSRTVYTT